MSCGRRGDSVRVLINLLFLPEQGPQFVNFRHSFEPGLAQFSPVLLFELSRGVLQTRPEGKRAPIPCDCDTYQCPWPLKAGNHQENRPSAFHWVVWKGRVVKLISICYRLLSGFPICLPVFFKQAQTRTHTDTHTHTRIFVQWIFALADYPEK